jgi:hypothetical protein
MPYNDGKERSIRETEVAKHIKFDKSQRVWADKPIYDIVNKKSGDDLGVIFYHAPWNEWVARFDDNSIWSHGCLADVQEKLRELGPERKLG